MRITVRDKLAETQNSRQRLYIGANLRLWA